jgi:hypothetical protein
MTTETFFGETDDEKSTYHRLRIPTGFRGVSLLVQRVRDSTGSFHIFRVTCHVFGPVCKLDWTEVHIGLFLNP